MSRSTTTASSATFTESDSRNSSLEGLSKSSTKRSERNDSLSSDPSRRFSDTNKTSSSFTAVHKWQSEHSSQTVPTGKDGVEGKEDKVYEDEYDDESRLTMVGGNRYTEGGRNVYTECGRHGDEWLFNPITEALKSTFKKK